MSGICDTCRRKLCHAQGEGMKFCGFYVGGESNYEKLFGTPERAARTLGDYCFNMASCADCGMNGLDGCKRGCFEDYDALLEWLSGDAE